MHWKGRGGERGREVVGESRGVGGSADDVGKGEVTGRVKGKDGEMGLGEEGWGAIWGSK